MRRKRMIRRMAAIALGLAAGLGCLWLFFWDPTREGLFPVCPSIRWWALACPGCGGTRALYLLLHGDVWGAFAMNPLLMAALPALAVGGLWGLICLWQGRPWGRRLPRWLPWAVVLILVVYTVARNLPGSPLWPGALLHPTS